MNLILCGLPSCGKSYFGKKIATLHNRPFIDTDEMIEKKMGLRCSEIENFREIEKEVIRSLHCDNAVIALGGGAVLDQENVRFLKTLGTLFYLEIAFKEIVVRLQKQHRFFERLEERIPIYEKVADVRVNLNHLNENEVISLIVHGK